MDRGEVRAVLRKLAGALAQVLGDGDRLAVEPFGFAGIPVTDPDAERIERRGEVAAVVEVLREVIDDAPQEVESVLVEAVHLLSPVCAADDVREVQVALRQGVALAGNEG